MKDEGGQPYPLRCQGGHSVYEIKTVSTLTLKSQPCDYILNLSEMTKIDLLTYSNYMNLPCPVCHVIKGGNDIAF